MSGNPTEQVKEVLTAAASTSNKWAQNNVVNPIHSYLTTEKSSETENPENNISPEESEQIDRMDKEKVAEFLQEKHKSTAGMKQKS
ncbi:hypothetical protein BJX68DRAFT_262418 [Aspergillus pseudodeflectus]|uniref:Uncharacterized protein n=1 Tax=Aspergillus pseudodeflectus TaxID=176178 RepID=A0ABR4L308_9EURO